MSNVGSEEADVPVVIVLGATGVGKSYFINKATGDDNVRVGPSPDPATDQLLVVQTEINEQKLTLVDTIGFQDGFRSDSEVLQEISRFLADTYKQGWRLAGVLYMHNIISTGLPGSTTKNIRMLNILAGAKEIRHVTLVVIGLDTVESRASKRRVKELKVQWRNMLSSRSAVELFDGTKKGSHDILNRVLEKEQTIVLNIQREIVDQKLDLSGTAAGRLVRKEIEKLQAEVRHELDRRCRDMKGALYSEDEELAAIRELRNWFGRRLQELEDQKAPLLPSYERAQNQASQQELSDAHLSSSRSLLETSVKLIQRILRPKVPTGHRRLEWLCTCGETLYGDFKEATSGSLDQLAAKLKEHSGRNSQQSSVAQSKTQGKVHTRQPLPMGYSMPGGSDDSNPSIPMNPVGHIARVADPSSANHPLPTSLQLCIETEKNLLEMARLEISSTSSDGEIFARMREQYETTRRSLLPRWARFKRPEKAIYVKFRLGTPHVSIISGTTETPAIPPATEVSHNYKYDPCPIDEPPIDSRTFFHHFYAPAGQHTGAVWAERLPWKVGPALEPRAHGWGIHLEERPYWPLFTALMFVVVVLSATTAGIYVWKTGDSQTAVGIGTWLTAIQAAGIPVLFFWWA